MFISELSYSGFEPGLVVYIEDVIAVSNKMGATTSRLRTQTGVFDISYLNVLFGGYNHFYDNRETVIRAYGAIVSFNGTSYFERNYGLLGGAMQFSRESFMLLQDGSSVIVKENWSEVAGGGIYIDFELKTISSYYDCFLFFGNSVAPFCNAFGNCNAGGPGTQLRFIDNHAPYGSAIYGSTFSNCSWAEGHKGVETEDVTMASVNATIFRLASFSPIIKFSPPIDLGNNVINTFPLVILPKGDIADKVKNGIMPGQEFTLELGSFDQLLQPVPLTIFSQVNPLEGETTVGVHASIGETDRYLLTGGSRFTSVPITIFANEEQSLNVTISTDDANVQLNFFIRLTRCQKGFQFNNDRLICECLVNKTLSQVQCQPDGGINYPANAWIGQDKDGNFILHDCIADFCEPMVTDLNLSEADAQCSNHRSGILCGECVPGYSRVLGSSACKHCPNNGYLALIVMFAILGIVLVVAISSLKLTITDGYLNGFIFYGSIISVLIYEFFPAGVAPPILVLTSYLSLNLGIETCFYNGMTPIAAVGLEFVFPFYLAGILLVITLFSRIWSRFKFKFLKDFNAAQVFATLLLLSYSSITFTCVEILGFVTIDSPSGTLVRWRGDPNVEYFAGLHLLLSLLSIVLLIILVPLPIPLLFPSLIFTVKRLVRLKPLMDAFVAPFAPRRCFWLGFRLIFRLALFLTIYLEDTWAGIITTILLTSLLVLQSYLQPFSEQSRNILDISLLLNLTVLSVIALYYHPEEHTINTNLRYVTLVFCIVTSVKFVALVFYYIMRAIPSVHNQAIQMSTVAMEKWENRMKSASSVSASKDDERMPMHTSVALD